MLLIGKENKKLKVTNKSFDNFYKSHGWEVIKEYGKSSKKSSKKEEDEWGDISKQEDEWEDVDEDVRKPLSEMNRQELEEYAAELGVDLSGLTSNKQIREAIKAVI